MDSNNSATSSSNINVSGITWNTNNGLLQATNDTGSTVINTIDFVFQKNDNTGSASVSDSTLTITGGGKITSSRQPVLQLTSSQGIMLGNDGEGKISVDFVSANYATDDGTKSRTVILDFSGVSSGIALKGNILLGTGSATADAGHGNEESFIAKFGGEGMQGNITINKTGDGDGFKSKFIFSGDANLDGDLILGANNRSEPNNTFIFDNGDILGTISTKANGSTTIIYGQENKTLATSLDIMAGTLTYKFADTVTDNKIFTLDASKANISGGRVVFDGVSQLVFKNGNSEGGTLAIAPKTDGSTYQNGSLVINLDSSAQANANNPIIKGSLSANKGSIFIGLKDPSGKTGVNPFTTPNAQLSSLDTYYVTGSVSITDGGISAFWNDSLGFYGKLSTPITASGNLIGKNDVWFSQAQSIKSIQATSGGTSHLVFDSKATLTGDSSIGIRATQNNATQILFKKGAVITGNITQDGSGYNNITFDATSSITGDIIAKQNHKGNDGTDKTIGNTIVFNHGGTIEGAVTVTVEGGYSWRNYNLNAITFNGTEDATIEGAINATDGGSGRGNVIKFNGSGNNKIVGNISTSPDSAGASGRNYIVFGANSSSAVIDGSVTVQGGINDIEFKGANGVIDGQVVANVSSGNNDGNKITFANGGSITGGVSVEEIEASATGYTLNTITFNGTNDATISGGITSNDGSNDKGNIISFNGTGTNRVSGGISAGVSAWGGAGRNAITFASGSTSSIDGNLETTLGGVNIITFSGANGSITGNIKAIGNGSGANQCGNVITFANGGSIEGNISTDEKKGAWVGYTRNNITFNGSNNATITGDIFSIDGSANQGNFISFNGTGLNKIDGDITASAGEYFDGSSNLNSNGRNVITFGTSDQTAIIDGNITAENNAKYFDRVGGINQINTSSSLTVTGNIVVNRNGANNFDLKADGITLTLQGANSKITALTALDGATNGNTLTLDATNNANVNATIDTLTNGDKLNVNFKGINEANSTKLTLDTGTNTALRLVTAESGINNTLKLTGTAIMSITEAVTIGDATGNNKKGVIFDLSTGSSLTFSKNLTTNAQGIVSFNLGGTSNTITGTLTNNGVNNFNLASVATTLQYGSDGLAFSSGENNINFKTGTSTLNWKNSGGTALKNISTTGGTTNFNLADGADSTITAGSTITTSGGATNINFGEGTKLTVDSIATSASSTPNTSSTTTLNFNGNGELAGALNTSGGTTNINIAYDKKATIGEAIATSGGATNVFFNAGTSTSRDSGYSILELGGATNAISSVTSDANGVILLNGANGATIDEATINKSLIFAFEGEGASVVTASNGITVGKGATLGISLKGTKTIVGGAKEVKTINGNIELEEGSTLIVDFQAGNTADGAIGSGPINIKNGSFSVINFHAGNQGSLTNGNIAVKKGGTNTVNFYGDASLSGVVFESEANSIINVASDGTGITGTIVTSSVGSVTNTINLDDNATLSLKASEGGNAGEGSLISESLNNTLNFKGDNTTLQGSFGAKSATEGKAFINVGSADKTQVSGTITGTVSYANLAFNAGDSKLILQGKTNTLKDITSQATKGTLVLDTATNRDEVNVEVSGNGTIGAGKELNIEFGGNSASKFEVKGKMSVAGTLGITVNGDGAKTVAGNIDLGGRGTLIVDLASGSGTVSLGDGTQSISIRNGETSIINFADGSTASLSNGISLDGGRNELNFARSATVGNIKLNQGTNIIDIAGKEIQAGVTTGNTVELTNIGSVGSVANTINLGKNAEIKIGSSGDGSFTTSLSNTLNFNGESAKFSGGFGASGSGVASINVNATGASITGNVANSSLIFGTDATTITLEGTNNTLTTISTPTSKNIQSARMARAVTGNTLTLSTTASRASSTMVSGAINAKDLTVELGGTDATHNATLTLSGGTLGAIKVTSGDASANTLGFRSGTTTIIGAIDKTAVDDTLGLKLNLNGGNLILAENIDTTAGSGLVDVVINNATLQLKGTTANVSNGLVENKINSLSGNGVVDLAVADFDGNTVTRSVRARAFKTFTIANYSGNHTFNLYVDPKNPDTNGYKADQVIVTSGSGSATFTVTGNIDDILGITYNSQKPSDPNNVQVASGMTNIEVSGGDSLIGYDIIQAQVIKDGGNVYLGQAISKGVAQEIKDVASSALTVNYDLFLANFNSLNKRMGELRDNPHSQGVWTRVFGGAMSNDFGAGSKTEYVTAQAGYDYSLTLGDARNYMGIAVAYGHSTTKSNALNIQASQGATIALQDVKSNMVEVGIYNSYVMDSGWYNDTIFKFDYIMSSFTMTDNLSLESETNNFAMVLSDEFGYRYKFAENEKGNWYIDPQVEVAFGYFNQSDFNRAMLATNSTLEASQDNILTLRTRAGLSLGKKFNTSKGFASLYVGAFYEYDYINGGDAEVLSKSGIANPLDKLESNGRAIVNIGSNIELTEGVRMYIDVEKSFGDKQRTDMQFNFGARYSFGEKTPTISYQEAQKKRVAPLKVEDKQEATTQATSKQEAKN